MLTGNWLVLNLRQRGQPDFLHEPPLQLMGYFVFPQNLNIYLT